MTTTDIVLHSGRELAITEDFATKFPAIAPTAEMAEIMLEILGDEKLEQRNLPRIKVPSADFDRFSFELGGKTHNPKTIKGIMVHYVAQRAFWTSPIPTGVAPECSASDNKHADRGGLYHPDGERGADNPTGLCSNCPMAQKGTDLNGGKMAACKEQRRLFIVLRNTLLPVILTAPPSSIGGLKDFLVQMAMAGHGWWALELEFGLEKTTNAQGQSFNVLTVAGAEEAVPLGDNEVAAAVEYRRYIQDLIAQDGMPAFDAESTQSTGGFSVGDAPTDEAVPVS